MTADARPDESLWLRQQFGLSGRIALVTGARSGIGRASALALAAAGADVILWGRRDGDCDELAAQVESLGRSAWAVTGDLADRVAVQRVAGSVIDAHEVDVLVNNGGTIRRAPAAQTSIEDWDAVLRVNLDAAFVLSQVIGRSMLARGRGSIVNVASLLSFQGGVNVAAYAASKHALAGLTRALANEWAPRGVNVNAVAPGYVETDNTAALRGDPERRDEVTARIPAGRWAVPADIAGAVVFLASPAAAYVHGQVLPVDGGWMGR